MIANQPYRYAGQIIKSTTSGLSIRLAYDLSVILFHMPKDPTKMLANFGVASTGELTGRNCWVAIDVNGLAKYVACPGSVTKKAVISKKTGRILHPAIFSPSWQGPTPVYPISLSGPCDLDECILIACSDRERIPCSEARKCVYATSNPIKAGRIMAKEYIQQHYSNSVAYFLRSEIIKQIAINHHDAPKTDPKCVIFDTKNDDIDPINVDNGSTTTHYCIDIDGLSSKYIEPFIVEFLNNLKPLVRHNLSPFVYSRIDNHRKISLNSERLFKQIAAYGVRLPSKKTYYTDVMSEIEHINNVDIQRLYSTLKLYKTIKAYFDIVQNLDAQNHLNAKYYHEAQITGRDTCALQNIPKVLRQFITPDNPSDLYVAFDIKHFNASILAKLSQDPQMLIDTNNDNDIYNIIAADNNCDRDGAKTIFMRMTGSKKYNDYFQSKYPTAFNWLETLANKAVADHALTLAGNTRTWASDIADSEIYRDAKCHIITLAASKAFRKMINNINAALPASSKWIMSIHDSGHFTCSLDDLTALMTLVYKCTSKYSIRLGYGRTLGEAELNANVNNNVIDDNHDIEIDDSNIVDNDNDCHISSEVSSCFPPDSKNNSIDTHNIIADTSDDPIYLSDLSLDQLFKLISSKSTELLSMLDAKNIVVNSDVMDYLIDDTNILDNIESVKIDDVVSLLYKPLFTYYCNNNKVQQP